MQNGAPSSVQLPEKNVYGRYNELVNGGSNGL